MLLSLTSLALVAEFALTSHMKYVSFWAFNRDFPGADLSTTTVSPDQSTPYQFFETFASVFNGDSAVSPKASSSDPPTFATVTVTETFTPTGTGALPTGTP
jgi:hypothetical protein